MTVHIDKWKTGVSAAPRQDFEALKGQPESIRGTLELTPKEESRLIRPGQTAMDFLKVKAGALVAKHPLVPPFMRSKVVELLITKYLTKYNGDLPGLLMEAANEVAEKTTRNATCPAIQRAEYVSEPDKPALVSDGTPDSDAFLGW